MNWLNLNAIKTARGEIQLPGSKSISNRILLLASLAGGVTLIRGLLASDDTSHMLNALQVLGVPITKIDADSYSITGCNGKFPRRHAELSLGNAGTAFRPLVAVLALMQGRFKLSGTTRMHERPIADLVDTLRQLGANISYLENEGYPPLEIKPADNALNEPLDLIIKGNVSSQFLSSLLIALPLIGNRSTISVSGVLISKPYVELTLAQMKRFDVRVNCNNRQKFVLPGQQFYRSPGEIMVEGDASSASYFLAAGAIGGGPVRVCGVGSNSLQGDICFAEALEKMGANITRGENWIESQAPQAQQTDNQLKAIDLDCNHIPDAAMTLAIVALFARGTTTLRNIASWRLKETDRLAAMARELRKLGAQVKEGSDFLRIKPPVAGLTQNASINTYDDHRMAMCFSLAAFGGDIRINDPGCVSKTFPDYFNQFAKITHV